MRYTKLSVLVVILLSFEARGQDIDKTLAKFQNYHQQTPIEKAYLHTDKEVYIQNETLWFSAYLVDGTSHIPKTPSSLLYVDLLDPQNELVASLPIKIKEGVGSGEFFLADSLSEGTYTLLAYTNYMRNFDSDFFFSKPIKFFHYSRDTLEVTPPDTPQDIDFQLFPEGGQLVAGMANIIAYRAVNETGAGIDIKGQVVNSKEEVIEEFSTRHLGMGLFQFIPKDNENYIVIFDYANKSYSVPLPPIKNIGYNLSVRQDALKTHITVNASPGLNFRDSFVIAHVRGKVIAIIRAKSGKDFIYSAINNNEAPSGIMHFTVFKSGKPILERLTYIANQSKRPTLTTRLKNESLGQREVASFELYLNSIDSSLSAGSVSVSVLKTSESPNRVNIDNFLLLTSDLRGTIEQPESYFDQNNPYRKKDMDLLMLTHGWRKFDWQDVLKENLPPISYYPEDGFTIEGQVVDYYNREKGYKTGLELSFAPDLTAKINGETEEDGTFWFDGLDVYDTTTAIIRTVVTNPTKSQKKKVRRKSNETTVLETGTFISIKERDFPVSTIKHTSTSEMKESYRTKLDTQLEIDQLKAEFDEKTILLDDIEVTAKKDRKSEPYYRDSGTMPYRNPDTRVIMDSIDGPDNYYSIFNMVSRVLPMVQVDYNQMGQKMFVYRQDSLVVYLDGIEIINLQQLAAINPENVEFMDLMRGFTPLNTGIISAVGLDGLPTTQKSLFIYSRTTPKKTDPNGLRVLEMYGYYQPAKFYIPKYDIMSAKEKLKPDYRATQYWNPKVKFSDMKASFSYYTSDNIGDFIMYIEGITNDGRILKNQFTFSVN